MSLQQQFTQVVGKIKSDRQSFESLVAEMREEKAPGNV
jgi:hypothetical protein